MKWKHGSIRVYYNRKLNGGGTILSRPFIEFIKSKGQSYKKAFEWCAGPGFIGFALLAEGICDRLCLADINPKALECIKKTVEKNGLQDKVSYYLSDNLKDTPKHEKFDLVVSNPPNYCGINPKHKGGKLRRDLRPSDLDWMVHRDFYNTIKAYLNEDATLLISEVEPFKKKFSFQLQVRYLMTREIIIQ